MGKSIKYEQITATKVTDRVLKLEFSDNKVATVDYLTQSGLFLQISAIMGSQRRVKFMGYLSEDGVLNLAKEIQ